MFKIGDKVIDSLTNQIGTVSHISTENLVTYPITVDFPDYNVTYTTNGMFQAQTDGRYIKKIEDITGTIKVSPTHIYIPFYHNIFLLPIALTSFKIVTNILVVTYNGKEYPMCIENIDQVIEQILNSTKKELL